MRTVGSRDERFAVYPSDMRAGNIGCMRVLAITNDFPPRVGGVNTYVAELLRRFPQGTATVLASDWPDAAGFDAGYPHEVIRWPRRTLLPTAAFRREVERLTTGLRPDIILFGAAAPLALMGPPIHRRTGVPYATFTHGVEFLAGRTPPGRALLQSIVAGAVLTMGVSRWAVHHLRRAAGPEARIALLPPGIDPARLHPGVCDVPIRERHGIDDDPVVCCVARLVPRKGQDQLIRALPQIGADVGDVRLLIVGSGPDRDRLKALARRHGVERRVIFAGEVAPEELPMYLRAGDVFAMPNRSRWFGLEAETFGIVFLEAAAVGRPTVAGDSGGAPEAVIHGETGLVVDGRDVDEIAWAVVGLLGDAETAAVLGSAGAARAHRDLTWSAAASRLQGLLSEAVARA